MKVVHGLSCWSEPSELSVNGEKNMIRVFANLRTGHFFFNQHSLQDLAAKIPVPSLKKFRNCCVHFMASVDPTQLKIQSIHMELEKMDYFCLAIAIHQKHFLAAQTMSCLVFSLRGGQRSMMLTSLCMFAFQVH